MTTSLRDIRSGVRMSSLAWKMATLRLQNQYRGSMLGPFWITISTACFFVGLAIVYSQLWGVSLTGYFPWLAIGFAIWILLSTSVSEACVSLISYENIIKSKQMPISLFAFRHLFSNCLLFLHQAPLFILILPIANYQPSWSTLTIFPVLLLYAFNIFFLGLTLGAACARFRDLQQIVATMLQLLFFLTPIIWMPDMLGDNAHYVYLNPITSFIEIFRAPLLGQTASYIAWTIVGGITSLNVGLAFLFLGVYRSRIVFWV